MAIDYGSVRTGIAVTDTLQMIATGLETVETSKLFNFLKTYFSNEEVETIVVGEPKNLDGTNTHNTLPVKDFINKLKQVFPTKKIALVDERFTSSIAKQTILNSGIGMMKRRNKGLVDKVSAMLILQSYLQTNSNK